MVDIREFILGKEKFNAEQEIEIVDNSHGDDPLPNKKRAKDFSVPSKSTMPSSTGTASVDKVQMQIEIEYFDVLHTKHLTQKSKVWEDGFLEYHVVP
jgi:hypothetical protein